MIYIDNINLSHSSIILRKKSVLNIAFVLCVVRGRASFLFKWVEKNAFLMAEFKLTVHKSSFNNFPLAASVLLNDFKFGKSFLLSCV